MRPLILNGIDDPSNRGDLLDRTILLTLSPIQEKERIPEKEFWARFEEARPQILGSLLDIVSKTISILPTIKLEESPRMADFALVGVAVEKVLDWGEGAFLKSFQNNRINSNALPLETEFAIALIEFARNEMTWSGTATELLKELNTRVDDTTRKEKDWPKSPQAIGNNVWRLAPNLRNVGVDIQRDREGKKGIRKIKIEFKEETPNEKVEETVVSVVSHKQYSGKSYRSDREEVCQPMSANNKFHSNTDDADKADDEYPHLSDGQPELQNIEVEPCD